MPFGKVNVVLPQKAEITLKRTIFSLSNRQSAWKLASCKQGLSVVSLQIKFVTVPKKKLIMIKLFTPLKTAPKGQHLRFHYKKKLSINSKPFIQISSLQTNKSSASHKVCEFNMCHTYTKYRRPSAAFKYFYRIWQLVDWVMATFNNAFEQSFCCVSHSLIVLPAGGPILVAYY